jgi:hypothetical protein
LRATRTACCSGAAPMLLVTHLPCFGRHQAAVVQHSWPQPPSCARLVDTWCHFDTWCQGRRSSGSPARCTSCYAALLLQSSCRPGGTVRHMRPSLHARKSTHNRSQRSWSGSLAVPSLDAWLWSLRACVAVISRSGNPHVTSAPFAMRTWLESGDACYAKHAHHLRPISGPLQARTPAIAIL